MASPRMLPFFDGQTYLSFPVTTLSEMGGADMYVGIPLTIGV